MKRHLFVLLGCLFVMMIGFGITLPVLPFYVERLALARIIRHSAWLQEVSRNFVRTD